MGRSVVLDDNQDEGRNRIMYDKNRFTKWVDLNDPTLVRPIKDVEM